jgi:hypothetical protein
MQAGDDLAGCRCAATSDGRDGRGGGEPTGKELFGAATVNVVSLQWIEAGVAFQVADEIADDAVRREGRSWTVPSGGHHDGEGDRSADRGVAACGTGTGEMESRVFVVGSSVAVAAVLSHL